MTKLNDAMVEAIAAVQETTVQEVIAEFKEDLTRQQRQYIVDQICRRNRSTLTAALAIQPEAEQGWQPIETAPKDGTPVDLLYPYPRGRTINCQWTDEIGWHWHTPKWVNGIMLAEEQWFTNTYPNMQPTHWRPPPAPPPAEGGQKG